MPARPAGPGRHRFDDPRPGLVHCTELPAVAAALAQHRHGWWHGLLVPARHSLAGLRRRAAAPDLRWAGATA